MKTLALTLLVSLSVCLSHAKPANDMFAKALPVTGTSIVVIGSNVGATKEPGEPDHAGDPGGLSVWWTWTAPSDYAVLIRTG